jgi:hypothetical protein
MIHSVTDHDIMILGGPNAGKTHYGGQLYGRLQRARGRWQVAGTPKDLSVFTEVLARLDRGLAGDHTAFETHAELCCPIVRHDGLTVELRWPDYGGEQFDGLLRTRSVPEPWQARLGRATGWLLLLRASGVQRMEDRLDRRPTGGAEVERQRGPASWDVSVRIVETLQILLTCVRASALRRLTMPRLAVVLSCWDQLEAPETPRVELHRRLPLLEAFVDSRWERDAWSVWGLSSLERTLDRETPSAVFCDLPPEERGYVVAPDEVRPDPDLTLPVDWMLGSLS